MRQDLKEKLDRLERGERLRKRLVAVSAAAILASFAYIYIKPSVHLEDLSAVVESSETGVDHWGQKFYLLRARLPDGRIVVIDPGLATDQRRQGETIEVSHFHTVFGRHVYKLKPGDNL